MMHSPSVVDLQSVCRLPTVCTKFAGVEKGMDLGKTKENIRRVAVRERGLERRGKRGKVYTFLQTLPSSSGSGCSSAFGYHVPNGGAAGYKKTSESARLPEVKPNKNN